MKPQGKEMSTGKTSPIFPSFSQQPWILQLRGTKERTVSFINPLNGSIEERSVPEMQGKVSLGCFGEWILLLQRKSNGMSLLNLTTLNEIMLPAMPEALESLGCFALSSSPSSPKSIIVTVGKERNFILYCGLKDQKWTKIQPIRHQSYNGEITICQGRIYALLVNEAVMIIDLESLLTGAICGEIMSLPDSFGFQNKIHLVTSGENAFFVEVNISLGLVTDVHIYTLDTSQLASRKFELLNAIYTSSSSAPWVRAGSINCCVFLLSGDYNTSVPANRAGEQSNCMYLLQQDDGGSRLYKICWDDQTTTSKVLLLEENNAWKKLYWVVPSRSRNIKSKTVKSSTAHISEDEERTSEVSISWTDMPIEIVQGLLSFLPLPDRIRLTSVCKSWNSFSKYIQDLNVFPWLISSSDSSYLNCFDSFYGVKHCLQMDWLASQGKLTFHCSKDGWFIASDRDQSIFMLNPLTKQWIKLPPLYRYYNSHISFSFSSTPTHSNCIVLAVSTENMDCLLRRWHRGLSRWVEKRVSVIDNPFSHVPACPVFFHDEFYILGSKGDLLVFSPTTNEYRFPNILAPIYSEGILDTEKECYLLELDGDLIYVFKRSTIESYCVYKLDQQKMVRMELRDLGGMTAFLSCFSSMSRPSRKGVYANGMLFPRLYGEVNEQPVLYSMKNHAFQQKLEDTKRIMNCVWFEPNLFVTRRQRIRRMLTLG